MPCALALVLEVGGTSGPDLTRYLSVCAASIAALGVLAWVFRRFVARHVRARAARRSLQILDVLPLSGKQRLMVVRCYDRSFLLGVGDREVRAIAELEPSDAPVPAGSEQPVSAVPFGAALEDVLAPRTIPAGTVERTIRRVPVSGHASRVGRGGPLDPEDGVLA